MNAPTIGQITAALETYAPIDIQEDYDNCGLLVGKADTCCSGALLTVDCTPAVVREAIDKGCNLIVAHHPLIFHGLKRLNGKSAVEEAVITAIRGDIAIYACHTCLDNAPGGVSWRMADKLCLSDIEILAPKTGSSAGCGVIGTLPSPMTGQQLIELVKHTFGSPVARCTDYPLDKEIRCVALCGGSGSSLIDNAIDKKAQAFITSDTKYHDFVDHAGRILIIDIGHHESENCTKEIFYHVIKEKFPNFAVQYSGFDINPIKYL